MAKLATSKQINFIKKLNPSVNEEDLKNLTIKDASIMINKLLHSAKEKAPETKKSFDLKNVNFEELYKKYNAYSVDSTDSNYNDINGVNKNSELLKDSRKFKSFISNVIKTEFPNIKFKVSCSFAGWNNYCDITLYLADPFKTYEEASVDFGSINHPLRLLTNSCLNIAYQKSNFTTSEIKYFYNNYFKVIGLTEERYTYRVAMAEYLKPEVKALRDFLKCLLRSYSYDHSDIMTDYFSYGLRGGVSIYDSNISEEQRNEAYNKANSATAEEIETEGAETPEERAYISAKFEAYRKTLEEESARREEQRKLELEEHEKEEAKIEALLDDSESYEVKNEPQVIRGSRFSTWNKPCTLKEASEFVEEHQECKDVGTVAMVAKTVNIKNQELFDILCHKCLRSWAFLNDHLGGCGWLKYENGEFVELDEDKQNEIFYSKKSAFELSQENYYWVREVVLIQFNGIDQFLVDPSGHDYCRYIGFLPYEESRVTTA